MAYPAQVETRETKSDQGSIREQASDEVFVMENNSQWQVGIAEALHELELKARFVYSAEEALQYAHQGIARYFILDVYMGPGKNQEGLDALEQIKEFDESIFVAVYSSYRDRLEQALSLGADAAQMKSADKVSDMQAIADAILDSHLKKSAPHLRIVAEKRINKPINKPVEPSRAIGQGGNLKSREPDKNHSLYEQLRSDHGWVEKHQGNYIAIVDGELVAEGKDKKHLLQQVRKDYAGKGNRIYFTQVEEQEEIIRLHSPLYVKD